MKEDIDANILIAEIFVDDIIFGGNHMLCKSFENEMRKGFEMSMFGEINFFLGLQIMQQDEGIFITQSKYIKEVLKIFKMKDSKSVGTLIATGWKLKREDKSPEVNQNLDRSMIGKRVYVVHNRPDITHVVGIVARFSANPCESHMTAMKRILRYQKNSEDYGLWYRREGKFELKVFTNTH